MDPEYVILCYVTSQAGVIYCGDGACLWALGYVLSMNKREANKFNLVREPNIVKRVMINSLMDVVFYYTANSRRARLALKYG